MIKKRRVGYATWDYVLEILDRIEEALVITPEADFTCGPDRDLTFVKYGGFGPQMPFPPALKRAEQLYQDGGGLTIEARRTYYHDPYDGPLDHFMGYILEQGKAAPPEVLIAIAMAGYEYFEARGDKTLEECYFGKPSKRAGNYARRRIGDSIFRRFHRFTQSWDLDPTMPLIELAAEFLEEANLTKDTKNRYSQDSSEAFLKAYQRWRKNAQPIEGK